MTAIEEYLDTDYSPDREFVDGTVVERHVGERPHSRVQFNVIFSLGSRCPMAVAAGEDHFESLSYPGRLRYRAEIAYRCLRNAAIDLHRNSLAPR